MNNPPSVRTLTARYLSEETPRKAANTQRHDASYAAIFVSALGDTPIADLSPREVAEFHREVTTTRGPVLANRVLSLVSQVCALAERDNLRPAASNPTSAVRRNTESRRTNFLSPALRARFLDAATELLGTRAISRSAWTLMVMMLLTGMRWSDARLLRWDEVDLVRGVVRFHPRGRLRPQNKGTNQRVVPLSDEAIELLRLTPRTGPWVAPSPRSAQPYTDIRKPLWRVCAIAGVMLTPHWLRHTFGTAAAEAGCTSAEIASALGHRSTASAEVYVHLTGVAARRVARRVGAASIGRAT